MRLFRLYSLDVTRAAAKRREFDHDRGFGQYAADCHCQSPRQAVASAVADRGVALIPVLSESRAHDILSDLRAAEQSVRPNEKGIDYSEPLEFGSPSFLLPYLDEILGGCLDAEIGAHFQSEYLIYSLNVFRTLPGGNARRAFLWHCDTGPRRFLKVLLYLNAGHGGNTEFLDRATTADFERVGYVFCPTKRRSEDLAPLARANGIRYEPIRWPVRPGDALLFEPAGVLHRGILPTTGQRYLISLMLMPSPVPWRRAFERMAVFCQDNAGAWVGHADELRRMVRQ